LNTEFDRAKARAGSLSVAIMLAGAGGFLDGFTYVGHGHVFANAMTANVVLLGAQCVTGAWGAVGRYAVPIAAFVAGVWASQAIQLWARRGGAIAPYGAVTMLNVVVLVILAFLPTTLDDLVFTSSVSFAAAVQMETYREVHGRSFGSTFTTGNLRTLANGIFTWLFDRRDAEPASIVKQFSAIIAAFVAGAIAGGFATKAFGNDGLWFDVGLLTLVALMVDRGESVAYLFRKGRCRQTP
jgi:uncharacterized membrane protein YoaK (UPF0700 family)